MKAIQTVVEAGRKGGKSTGPNKARPKEHYVAMGKKSGEARRLARRSKRESK
jgi:general stress protein YciG